jgi:hypothetical protein
VESYAFRYYHPDDAPLPQVFEKVLFPIVYNGPGAKGSVWKTELSVRNSNPYDVEFWQRQDLGAAVAGKPVALNLPESPRGRFVVLPRGAVDGVHFGSRIRDLSRSNDDWGTEIPVVREDDLARGTADLLNIPADRVKYRRNLRIYTPHPSAAGEYSVYNMADGHVYYSRGIILSRRAGCNTEPCISEEPAFAEFTDIDRNLPAFSVPTMLGIRITVYGGDPQARFWAFATITNNETQHVTIVSPQ